MNKSEPEKANNPNMRESFPNMTSLVQYSIWRDGERKIAASKDKVTVITIKAQSGGRHLVEMGLATVREEGKFLIFTAVPNGRLDRRVYPTPPDDVIQRGMP
jgi:hypothetical protein